MSVSGWNTFQFSWYQTYSLIIFRLRSETIVAINKSNTDTHKIPVLDVPLIKVFIVYSLAPFFSASQLPWHPNTAQSFLLMALRHHPHSSRMEFGCGYCSLTGDSKLLCHHRVPTYTHHSGARRIWINAHICTSTHRSKAHFSFLKDKGFLYLLQQLITLLISSPSIHIQLHEENHQQSL